MSFPTNPIDKQIYKNYYYDTASASWKKARFVETWTGDNASVTKANWFTGDGFYDFICELSTAVISHSMYIVEGKTVTGTLVADHGTSISRGLQVAANGTVSRIGYTGDYNFTRIVKYL